jgi:putative nucleotidyltransferase with HDIG domain
MRRIDTAFFYILLVVGAAAGLLLGWFPKLPPDVPPQMALFVSLIVIASFLIIEDPSGGVISSTGTLFYVVLYVFDPVSAFLIVALGYSIGNALPRPWVTWRTCFNGAQMGLSVFLGSLVYRGLGGNLEASAIGAQLIPAIAGPLVHQLANNFFIAFLISRMRNLRFFQTWANFVRELLWSNVLSIPTAILIAILYVRVHHVFALVFLLSLPFQRWALRLYLEKRKTYARIVEHLVTAGEMSLPGTRGHAHRVANLASEIGRRLGLAERDLEAIGYAALLHDIGMIGMDDQITSKDAQSNPNPLIDAHVKLGAEIVAELGRPDIVEMVLNHHTPYMPDPVTSNEVMVRPSLGARILTLCEDVDSQLHRLFPHRDPLPLESVLRETKRRRGSYLDPQVVDAFLGVVEDGETETFQQTGAEMLPVEG